MTRSNKIGLTVCALVLLALLAWLGSHMVQVPVTVHSGPTGEARTDPWLACERTLRELGLPTTHKTDLIELPPTDHALFLEHEGVYENDSTLARLLDWIEHGGRLVLLVPSRAEARSVVEHAIAARTHEFWMNTEFGVELATSYTEEADEHPAAEPAEKKKPHEADHVVEVDLGDGPLAVAMEDDIWIEGGSDSDEHEYCATFEHGAGRIAFVVSDAWLANEHFGEHDHARFAWQLANLGGRPAGVWCVPSEQRAGLLAWIAQEGWMVLASGAVFIALWLWKGAARFGPTLADPPRDRRDFSEHIAASADFLWRQGQAALMLAAPRTELRQRLALLRPDLASIEGDALHAELAQLSGLTPAAVQEALATEHVVKPEPFQRIVRNLALLRKSL